MRWMAALLVGLTLTACGGGGGGSASGPAAQAGSTTLVGVAAVGAGISGRISVIDARGQDRFVDTTDGHYRLTLAGMQPPLLLKAQWNDGSGSHRLYSFASAAGTVNISPLTHLAVSAAAAGQSPDTLYGAPSARAFAGLQSALPGVVAQLQRLLQPLLLRYAVADAHPITARFVPDHTGMDAVLDNLDIHYAEGRVSLADKSAGTTLADVPLAQFAASVSSGNWSMAAGQAAADLEVAVSPQGRGLVAWTALQDGHYALQLRWLDGPALDPALDPGQTLAHSGDAAAPRLAFDGLGNALLVWTVYSNQRHAVWASRYQAASGQWDAPQQLSAPLAAGSAHAPDLALDGAGNALVVWHQGDGRSNHADAWARTFSPAAGWAAPLRLSDGVNTVHGVRVALTSAGQGLVAWQQQRGDGSAAYSQPSDIWVQPVSTSAAWGAARTVNRSAGQTSTVYVYGRTALALNARGDAAVLWSQRTQPGQPMEVQAALYRSALGWQDASAINRASTEDSHNPQVALDAAGNAIAIWQQQTDYGAYGASNRYQAGIGWGVAGHFVDSKLGDAYPADLAMDAAGNATVVWYRGASGMVDLMFNRYLVGRGWGTAQVYAPVGNMPAVLHAASRVAANAQGQTLLVWGLASSAVASWL